MGNTSMRTKILKNLSSYKTDKKAWKMYDLANASIMLVELLGFYITYNSNADWYEAKTLVKIRGQESVVIIFEDSIELDGTTIDDVFIKFIELKAKKVKTLKKLKEIL